MVSVQVTGNLLVFFPALQDQDIVVDAATVAEAVREVDRLAPGFAFYVCDELGRLRRHVNIFAGEERVADRRKLSDPVGPGGRIYILQALSGG